MSDLSFRVSFFWLRPPLQRFSFSGFGAMHNSFQKFQKQLEEGALKKLHDQVLFKGDMSLTGVQKTFLSVRVKVVLLLN